VVETKNDPFWSKLVDAHDQVLQNPEVEVILEYGDKRAKLFAKRNAETRELTVVIEVEYIKGVGDIAHASRVD
jgi:hypothetical protein